MCGAYDFFAENDLSDTAANGTGLLSLYIAYNEKDDNGNIISTREEPFERGVLESLFGWKTDWNHIEVDVENKKLRIRRGWGANYMDYSLDGWTGRYGMPLEFLLSVHIATMKPDLTFDMAKSFETDVKILMQDASDSSMRAAYKKDWEGKATTATTQDEKEGYLPYERLDAIKSEGWFFTDGWTLSTSEAQDILELGIESPENCTGKAAIYVFEDATDNGDGGWFDKNYYNELKEYNPNDGPITELEQLKDSFSPEDRIVTKNEKFDLNELVIRNDNEGVDLVENAARNRFGYRDEIANLDIGDPWEWDAETRADTSKPCYASKSSGRTDSEDGYYHCNSHNPDYDPSSTDWWYCPNNVQIKIQGQISTRTWLGVDKETEGAQECEYVWKSYVYKVYECYLDSNKNEKKDFIHSYHLDYIQRFKSVDELKKEGLIDNEGNYLNQEKCHQLNQEKCCESCRRRVKDIMSKLSDTADDDFDTYIPYIQKVTDHWFRDVYFELSADEADGSDGDGIKLTKIDLDYEKMTNERWTEYEKNPDTGEDQLYYYDENASDRIGAKYNGTLEEAQEAGIKVLRKQVATYAVDLASTTSSDGTIDETKNSITLKSDGSWSAYKIQKTNDAEWIRAFEDKDAKNDIEKRIYYKKLIQNDIVQTQDGLRGVTNNKIKDMFLNKYYFSYDGTTEKAEVIQELRNALVDRYNEGDPDKFDVAYGPIKKEWLDDKFDITVTKTKIDDEGNESYENVQMKDVELKDYVSNVEITIDSLGAFTILENTHTLDADFIYKDFKELIVELGYFDKEELSDNIPTLLQFLVPTLSSSYGYPIRTLDKSEKEYGTFLHSKIDYEIAQKEALAAVVEKANAERTKMKNGLTEDLEEKRALEGDISSTKDVNISSSNTSISMGGSTPGQGNKTCDITVNGVTYEAYWQSTNYNCTLTAFAFIAQAYSDKSAKDFLTNSPYWSDRAGFYWSAFEGSGIPGSRITGNKTAMYEQTAQALSEGKPVYFYSSFQSTGGYHAIVLLGTDSDGKILYYNPWGGVLESFGNSSSPTENLKTLINTYVLYSNHCVFVPNEAPPGVQLEQENADIANLDRLPLGTATITPNLLLGVTDAERKGYKGYNHLDINDSNDRFIGFEGGEAVVSPVTGILLEYGVYNDDDVEKGYRMNIDKQGVTDKVGYAKILVLNDSISKQITTKGDKLKGLDVFAEEYENAHIAGFIIYIDGFKCEAPTASGTGSSGIELDMDYFKSKAATSSTDCSYTDSKTQTLYVPEITYELTNKKLQETKNTEVSNKNNMVPLYKFNASINEKTEEVLIIKQGTVIGRTYSNEELSELRKNEALAKEPDLANDSEKMKELIYDNTQIQGNYLRIIMRNNDDEVVENVEEYMELGNTSEKAD